MLAFEGVSLLFILVLGAAICMQTGFAIDMAQVTLQGAKPGGDRLRDRNRWDRGAGYKKIAAGGIPRIIET